MRVEPDSAAGRTRYGCASSAQTLAALTAGDLTSPGRRRRLADSVGQVEQAAEELRVSLLHVVGTVQQGLGTLHRGRATVVAINKETLGRG